MVVKSVSLVELKKQQWAKEKDYDHKKDACYPNDFTPNDASDGNIGFRLCLKCYDVLYVGVGYVRDECYFTTMFSEELVKLNGYWRNQNTPIVLNDQRDHVIYPEIRSNDCNDRLQGMNKDIQLQKNLSFPPISNDNQKQNTISNIYANKMENNDNHSAVSEDSKPKSTHTILNRTYTISKENSANRGGTIERQKWDKQYNVLNAGLNSPNLISNERRYFTNESYEIPPAWVECSERPSTISEIGKSQFEDYRKATDLKGSCDTLNLLDPNNVNNRTYLLGQNIPLTTEELAARELKRQKAMELQEAIKQQLKERQLKKKEDMEKKKQDDLAEERRIQKQQEIERKRLEDELKRQREKELCDERKAKAMQEVLENAQKQAKEDKSKNMQKKRINLVEIKEKPSKTEQVVAGDCEQKCCPPEPKPQQNVTEATATVDLKEVPDLPEVDVALQTVQTSPTSSNRQKLLTPSKFRNQTTSVAIQTEALKKPKTVGNVYQKSTDLDKRPKWGVNRPEVQYVKQSAKDPNYQLKLKQKSPWNRRTSNANSAKIQPDIAGRNDYSLSENYSKNTSAYGRPNFAEMKSAKHISNNAPSSSESISVSDVLYQLSSLRKVLETKRKHWKSVIADESPSSDSS